MVPFHGGQRLKKSAHWALLNIPLTNLTQLWPVSTCSLSVKTHGKAEQTEPLPAEELFLSWAHFSDVTSAKFLPLSLVRLQEATRFCKQLVGPLLQIISLMCCCQNNNIATMTTGKFMWGGEEKVKNQNYESPQWNNNWWLTKAE